MSKAVIVAIVGVLVALLPFSGFPSTITAPVIGVLGVIIVILGLLMRVERLWLLRTLRGEHKTDTYAENSSQIAAEASE